MRKLTLIVGASLMIWGCSSNQQKQQNADSIASEDSLAQQADRATDKEFDNVLESIPSPLEFSSLIQNSGAKFSETYLNKTENLGKYNSQYSKALNLGIYGADLGYINLYQKTYSSIDYLNTVFQLSTDLNIGEFFDFNTLKRLANNNKNLDSLVYITTKGFEKMHHHLKKTNNSQVSVLIMVGGWIEGLHLTSEIAKVNDGAASRALRLTVYDENVVLEDLLTLLSKFKSDPNITNLIASLENLKTTYASVSLSGKNKEQSIPAKEFNKIAEEIKAVREKLIQ